MGRAVGRAGKRRGTIERIIGEAQAGRSASCYYCFKPLIADQPGGQNPRHTDGVPYGKCPPAILSTMRKIFSS